jgi:predicted nucleic acid-binding protein
VVDTDVFSAVLIPESALARRYAPILLGRPVILCFQTVAELRFGALRRGWGDRRLRQVDVEIDRAEIVQSGSELITTYVELRPACAQAGHALGQREHDADRWIAATALRLGIPLVSNDRIFEGALGLRLESAHR